MDTPPVGRFGTAHGLLCHFPSKPALTEGLAERLRAFTDANLARADTEGVVRTFLQTSRPDTNQARHYWAVISAARADPSATTERTRTLLARCLRTGLPG